jgi:translation initiation factor IF-2
VEDAGPSTPVEVLGWSAPPQAGDTFVVMDDEREARELASKRGQLQREQEHRLFKHVTLTDLYSQIKAGKVSDLLVVLKGDVDGSVEALEDSLTKLSTDEVKLRVIHRGVGQISESDVLLAAASNAVIIGFHVLSESAARKSAERAGVEIRHYNVIYEVVDDLKAALENLLAPEQKERITGHAEIRQIFPSSKFGNIAGSFVIDGYVRRAEAFKDQRTEDLGRRAREAADRVRAGGAEELMPSMTPIERRIVHLALENDADVMTESRGDGFYKRVAIVRRSAPAATES